MARDNYNEEMEEALGQMGGRGRGGRGRDRDEDRDDDGDGKRPRKFGGNKKKKCRFTTGEEEAINITYKNPRFLAGFMTEHGKIVPRRVTGNCAEIQRRLASEIKRARQLALLGYTNPGPNAN
jgi:small subunit ribosomal protein S18